MASKNRLFLKNIIQVATLTALLLLPFELYFRFKVDDLHKKRDIIESRLDSTVIAVMGSSHTNFGIDPNYISKYTTNFAFPAQSLYYDCKLIEKYYSQMPNLKFVVFDLSINSFGYDEYQGFPRECFAYKKEYGITLEPQKLFDVRDYSSLVLSLTTVFPENVFNYFDKKFFSKSPVDGNAALINTDDFRADGFYRNSIVTKKEFTDQEGRERVKAHFDGLDSSYSKSITKLLEDTILKLKRNGIEIIFVTMPCHKVYYNHLSLKEMNDFCAKVSYFTKKYSIHYYDYLKDTRFALEDFADIDHLNYHGAKKLTIIFNEDLLNTSVIR